MALQEWERRRVIVFWVYCIRHQIMWLVGGGLAAHFNVHHTYFMHMSVVSSLYRFSSFAIDEPLNQKGQFPLKTFILRLE